MKQWCTVNWLTTLIKQTDERTCVSKGSRIESGMLHDEVDRVVRADKEDRVESRPELMKPALEGLQNEAVETEETTEVGVSIDHVELTLHKML